MRHIGLFEGIGGFSLAARQIGWQTIAWCEINSFCQRVLSYQFPNAEKLYDIKQTDFTIYRGKCDIITGGFPCQPYSMAGKRKGKEDERHLWPEMLRAIREIEPSWVVGENVYGIVNWNGGLVFDEVQSDLEAQGYQVIPVILPACAVNAPHRRDRVWFIAFKNTNSDGWRGEQREEKPSEREQRDTSAGNNERVSTDNAETWAATDTNSNGQHRSDSKHEIDTGQRGQHALGDTEQGNGPRNASHASHEGIQRSEDGKGIGGIREDQIEQPAGRVLTDWQDFPTESPLHRRDDGLPEKLAMFVVKDVIDEISKTSKENRIENLQEVWQRVQQEEVWEKIRGLYSLESKALLFQVMQLYSPRVARQVELSPFSEEVSKEPLRILHKYGEFRSSPQGQELEKQRSEQFGDSLSFMPHEVALAARAYTNSIRKFEAWHRQEAIKAYGNAIVPQVAIEIFKAIQQYDKAQSK